MSDDQNSRDTTIKAHKATQNILYDYDPEESTGPVPSPCIGICKMDDARAWCAGCFRTIPEITVWSSSSDDTKRQIWMKIKHRMFDHGTHQN